MGVPIDKFNVKESFDLKKCDCCGSKAVINRENVKVVTVDFDDEEVDVSVCMVCGDTKTIETMEERGFTIKKISYQISMDIPLQMIEEQSKLPEKGDKTRFLLGGERVKESEFYTILAKRRNILRSETLN